MKVPWEEKSWGRVLVYGLGASGTAAVRLLLERGASVVALDRRGAEELEIQALLGENRVEWRLGAEPTDLPSGIDGVVVSPGVPMDRPLLQAAHQRGITVISEVELAFAFLEGTIVAVTGTNGKSTTSALAGALLEGAGERVEVCGNFGVPLSSRVDGSAGRVFVVELSSFQLEAVRQFRAHAAALLNVSPDHLDRHPDLRAYAARKAEIFARQGRSDVAVVNADDRVAMAAARPVVAASGARLRLFSRRRTVEDGCYLEGDRVLEVAPDREPLELFERSDLSVAGLHNLENAMAAALLARASSPRLRDPRSDTDVVRRGLTRFQGLPHRLEQVRARRGVEWYDDSKGTNLDATLKSLEGFADSSVHLIVGGRAKGTDPTLLRERVKQKVRRLYLIGEAGPEFGRTLGDLVYAENVGTLEKAVARAARSAAPGEVVLLSPACASFDQFRNFVERGERFQSLVRALPEEGHG